MKAGWRNNKPRGIKNIELLKDVLRLLKGCSLKASFLQWADIKQSGMRTSNSHRKLKILLKTGELQRKIKGKLKLKKKDFYTIMSQYVSTET
jgi:hypothetical protein